MVPPFPTVTRFSSFSTMHQKHKSRNSSSIKNLVGMATSLSVSSGHGSSGRASPTRASPPRDEHFSFFSRTSSKTQISHLSDLWLSGSAGNDTSTSLPSQQCRDPAKALGSKPHLTSSRSLLDEATKLLHFHRKFQLLVYSPWVFFFNATELKNVWITIYLHTGIIMQGHRLD